MPTSDATELRLVRGACPHDCPDTCAWSVEVQDGRAIRLIADREHPFTDGGLCAKVNHFVEDRVYSDRRLTVPLRRVGPKGSGEFEEISWDEAVDLVADRLGSIVGEFGGEAVLPYSYLGTQGLVQCNAVSDPFFARLGASRLVRGVCGDNGLAGLNLVMGSGPGIPPDEIEHARTIVLWGTNTISTNLHLWPFIRKARDGGATVVTIDPVLTRTAKASDWHVQPLPGTDAALAMGLLHVMFAQGWEDAAFLEANAVGTEALQERVNDYPPDRVAQLTGVSAADVERLARMLAHGKPSVIRLLVGMEHREEGAETYRAIACLPVVTGAWRERGGGLCHMTFQHFSELDWSCGVGLDEPATREFNMVQVGRALTEADPPIRALVVYNSNPAVIAPDQRRVLEGLARDDLFTVVLEHVMTDTARYADVVLPATTQVEHVDVLWSWGHTFLTWNEPAIAPVGSAHSNAETFRALGQRLGFDDPAFTTSDQDLVDAGIAPLGEQRVTELKERGWIRIDGPDAQTPYGAGGFQTPSGKAELYSESELAAGRDPLPAYRPAREGLHGDEDLRRRFPLSLVTAKGAHHFLNSSYGHVERAVRAEGCPVVSISVEDAARRGIVDKSQVRVFNDRSSLVLEASVGDAVRPGVVSMPSGWWASNSPGGLSANALTADGVARGATGGDFHDTLVEVEPTEIAAPERTG